MGGFSEFIQFDENSPAARVVEALMLRQSDLKVLKKRFQEIDIDGSGEIDYDEFFEMIVEPRSPYADSLFTLIDVDGSGSIDFEEMMQVLATYCMYSKEDILTFCFDVFDKDGSGAIDEEEFMTLCKAVNNSNPMFPGNFSVAMREFDQNDDGLIDKNEFRDLNKRYPLILFPAFRLQDRMQRSTLGEKRWTRVHRNIHKKRAVEDYRNTHGGDFPPLSFWEKVRKSLTGTNPYSKLFRGEMAEIKMKGSAKVADAGAWAEEDISSKAKSNRRGSNLADKAQAKQGRKRSTATDGSSKGSRKSGSSGGKQLERKASSGSKGMGERKRSSGKMKSGGNGSKNRKSAADTRMKKI